VRRRGEFASHGPHFDSKVLNSSGLSAKKIKKTCHAFLNPLNPGELIHGKKSVDAFLLF
jgi:hypothetical protein